MADNLPTDEDEAAQTLRQHRIALGRRLRLVRRHLDITQDVLAERAGTTRPRLSHIECGRVNITFETLC